MVIWSDLHDMESVEMDDRDITVKTSSTEFRHVSDNGRQVSYQCATNDGKTATVAIDGRYYDSTNGALLLVSTASGRPVVRQLDVDVAKLPSSFSGLEDLARENELIGNFFAEQHRLGQGRILQASDSNSR